VPLLWNQGGWDPTVLLRIRSVFGLVRANSAVVIEDVLILQGGFPSITARSPSIHDAVVAKWSAQSGHSSSDHPTTT